MYCLKCRAKIPDQAKFCPKCGAAITATAATPEFAVGAPGSLSEPKSGPGKTKAKKRWLLIGTLVAVALIAVVVFALCSGIGESATTLESAQEESGAAVAHNATDDQSAEVQAADINSTADQTDEQPKVDAVEPTSLKVKVMYCGDDGWYTSREYDYDSLGRETLEAWYYSDGSIDFKFESIYDSTGRQLTTVYEGNTFRSSISREYTFDDKGKVIYADIFGEQMDHEYSGWMEYEYREDGTLQTCTEYRTDGEIESETAYDCEGKEYPQCDHYWSYGNGVYEYFYEEWTYDAAGNCLTDVIYNAEDEDHYIETERTEYTYTYDGDGNILTELSAVNGASTRRTEYTYDLHGNLRSKATTNYDSGSPSVQTVEYAVGGYDEEGEPLVSVSYTCDLNGNETERTEYTYDEEWNILEITTTDADGTETITYEYDSAGNLLSNGTCNYEYDADGNLLWKIQYDEDGSVWRKTEYTYDANGNLLREIKYAEDGSVRSKTEYTYDADGNLLQEDYYKDGELNRQTFCEVFYLPVEDE